MTTISPNRSRLDYITLLTAFVALLIPTQQLYAGSDLVVTTGTYSMSQHETYATATISAGALLKTNGYKLSVTGDGGLTCAGSLHVDQNGELSLTGGGVHIIDGIMRLKGSASLITVAGFNATFDGRGKVVGEDSDAAIAIASGVSLGTRIDIWGGLVVTGPGTFKNYAAVNADDADLRITLAPDLVLIDSDDCMWGANGGTIEFHHGQTDGRTLHGTIYLSDCGTLEIDHDITTSGLFAHYGGTLTVASDASFTYSEFTSPVCTNPGTGSGPYTVAGPYSEQCCF